MKRLALLLLVVACSTKSKAEVTEKAMQDDSRRAQIMEATLRVMDQHPEYVDEFFRKTVDHNEVLQRFLADTTRALARPPFAKQVARHLVVQPDALRETMIATMDLARDKPDAQKAITDAIDQRAELAAQYLKNSPDTTGKLKHLGEAMAK